MKVEEDILDHAEVAHMFSNLKDLEDEGGRADVHAGHGTTSDGVPDIDMLSESHSSAAPPNA